MAYSCLLFLKEECDGCGACQTRRYPANGRIFACEDDDWSEDDDYEPLI